MNLHLLVLGLLYTATAATQTTAVLSGQVRSYNQPIAFAEVLLLSPDAKLIAHTTVLNGVFNFEAIPLGNYHLRTVALGYLDDQQTITLLADQKVTISLVLDEAFLLTEVVVKEQQERFTNEGGNLRMNVSRTSLAASTNSLDLLSKLPGAILSADRESVTIIGQGSPLIYLNNQQITLAEFSAIPVSDIQDVELINNPSARFEANGRVVLLVRLRKQLSEGYRIELANNFSRKEGWNNNLTANANWNKNKLTTKLNLGYQQLQPWEQVVSSFSLIDQPFSSAYQSTVLGNRGVYVLGGGFSYQHQPSSSFSFSLNTRLRDGQGDVVTRSELQQDAQLSEIITETDQDDNRHHLNANFNYNKEWDKSGLFIGGQYLNYRRQMDAAVSNSLDNSAFLPTQIREQLFKVKLYAARLDFEYDFNEQLKGACGLNAAYTTSPTIQDITELSTQPATFTSSHFLLNEQTLAAYSQLSGPLRKLQWTLGIRAEQADVEGGLAGEDELRINRNQLFFFPNLSLSLPIDSTNSLTINYRRSIQRPNFSNLSQVAFYVNPFTVIQENTGLLASLQDDFSVVFQRQQNTLRFSYLRRSNPSFFTTLYDETQELYVLTRKNFDQANTFMLNLMVPFTRSSWSSVNSLSLLSTQTTDAEEEAVNSSPYLHFSTQQEVSLTEKISLSLRTWGMTKRKEGLFQRNALITADFIATLQWKEQWRISLSFNDIFNGYYFENEASIQSITSLQRFNVDSQEVALSIRYSLGKSKANFQTQEAFEAGNRIN